MEDEEAVQGHMGEVESLRVVPPRLQSLMEAVQHFFGDPVPFVGSVEDHIVLVEGNDGSMIQRLYLDHVRLDVPTMRLVQSFFRDGNATHVREFLVQGCFFHNDETVDILCEMLMDERLSSLKKVDMQFCLFLGSKGARRLFEGIRTFRFITQLCLGYFFLDNTDEDIQHLMNGIRRNRSLQKLGIHGHFIKGHAGGTSIATLLKNTCLKELDLQMSPLGDEGACALAPGLKNSPNLKKLILSSCGLGDKGGAAVLGTIAVETNCLEFLSLDYSSSPLTGPAEDGFSHAILGPLANVLKQGASVLQTLSLKNHSNLFRHATAETIDPLCETLSENKLLQCLYLAGCPIEDEAVGKKLLGSLRKNNILHKVTTDFDEETQREIRVIARRNILIQDWINPLLDQRDENACPESNTIVTGSNNIQWIEELAKWARHDDDAADDCDCSVTFIYEIIRRGLGKLVHQGFFRSSSSSATADADVARTADDICVLCSTCQE